MHVFLVLHESLNKCTREQMISVLLFLIVPMKYLLEYGFSCSIFLFQVGFNSPPWLWVESAALGRAAATVQSGRMHQHMGRDVITRLGVVCNDFCLFMKF